MSNNIFAIIALHSDQYFLGIIQPYFFPTKIVHAQRANWEAQNVSIGVKPLMYANREPLRIEVEDLLFDSSGTNESLRPQMNALKALQAETDLGTPPPLLIICGDFQESVVLEELNIVEDSFHPDGRLLRARVSMVFIQLQQQREKVTVTIKEPSEEDTFDPLGNF
jgi:hypothetical protein